MANCAYSGVRLRWHASFAASRRYPPENTMATPFAARNPLPRALDRIFDRDPFPPRPTPKEWLDILKLHERFDDTRLTDWLDSIDVLPLLKQRISILIVSDSLQFSNDPNDGFALGMAIDALRENFNPCYYFDVHLARRGTGTFTDVSNPGSHEAKYLNFRFDARDSAGNFILNRYDQVWCFGLMPGNGAFTDTEVDGNALRATDSELAVLSRWMDERDGGVFATGDHAHLGAVMSARIPRVGTMRKWMIADGPPTFLGSNRFDTNQPKVFGDTSTTILNANQEDEVPQRVQLVPERIIFESAFRTRFEPHPIMCAGKLGAIDVFPDHQHEGQVIEDGDVVTGNNVNFSGSDGAGNTNSYSAAEYPNTRGAQTVPRIIARAGPMSSPPYTFEKGVHSTARFGMVGIYDGHREGVGRVVVDSTWHHWLNVNLRGFAADTSSSNYAKIKTYFRNVGLWLSNRLSHRRIYRNAVWNAHLTYEATQEVSYSKKWWVEGRAIDSIIKGWISPCQFTQWHLDFIVPPNLEVVFPPWKIPEPCLSCPPFDFIKWSVLTEISANLREPIAKTLDTLNVMANSEKRERVDVSEKEVEALLSRGISAGLQVAAGTMKRSLERGSAAVQALSNAGDVRDVR
jgi:hypothetical protein